MYEGASPTPVPGKPQAERRLSPRIDIATKVNFAVVIPTYETGAARNISQGGMNLEMKRKMATGTILRLEFDMPGDKPEHIEVLGRVMWQKQINLESITTGVKFLT